VTDDPRQRPFDPLLRAMRLARSARSARNADFLHRRAGEELLDRLDLVNRRFGQALDFGRAPGWLTRELAARGLEVTQADEHGLPFPVGHFDLAISVGLLDTINDLPGAFALIRRALKPDGLFLAAFLGAGSLAHLKHAMRAGEEAQGLGASPRIHPQIDVRAAGDLLTRAGFALPVVDREIVEARYASMMDLVSDLRAMGATSQLAGQQGKPFGPVALAAAMADFEDRAIDGRTVERFEIVYLSSWAPSPNQPRPARRGSGTAPLAEALKPKR